MFLITASSLFIFQTSHFQKLCFWKSSQAPTSVGSRPPSKVGQLDYYITLFASCQVLFLLFLKKFFRTLFSAPLSRSDLLSISPYPPFVNTFFTKMLSVFWIFFLSLIMRTAQNHILCLFAQRHYPWYSMRPSNFCIQKNAGNSLHFY